MKWIKKIFWRTKALLACIIYGFPAKKLILIGVTGTDGKTTTTVLIHHILQKSGCRAAYVSTVGAKINEEVIPLGFHVTTPRFFALQKYLRQAVNSGIKYVVLEVTSHAIDQERIWGCPFKIAVLTNITNEHLDYHQTYNNYAKTKLKLINKAQIAVINRESSTFYRYQKWITNQNVWYTSLNKKTEVNYQQLVDKGLKPQWVDFEKENIVLAYTVCRLLGVNSAKIISAINNFERVLGRYDYFIKDNRQFLVDFAHTPNSFVRLYQAVKQFKPKARLIHVFGCAGKRDTGKRAKMGFTAAANADLIILTEEDYRQESLTKINQMIETGIKKVKHHRLQETYFIIDSRQEAINFAVKKAGPEDLIILTGKAHEQSLARGNKEYPWDEYQAIELALKQNQ